MLNQVQDPDHTLVCSFRIDIEQNKPNFTIHSKGTLKCMQIKEVDSFSFFLEQAAKEDVI